MRFPKLNVRPQSREFIQEFGGLDRRVRISDNCFSEMKNLTGDFYPALAPRRRRGVVGRIEQCNAMTEAAGRLAYVDGNILHWGIGTDAVTMELTAGADIPRQLVMMGAYLVVFPDNKYLNTANTGDRGAFHIPMDSATEEFSFSLYRRENADTLPQTEENLLSGAVDAKYQLTGSMFKANGTDMYLYHAPQSFEFPLKESTVTVQGVPNPYFFYWVEGASVRPFSHYEVSYVPDSGNGDCELSIYSNSLNPYAMFKCKGGNGLWGKIIVKNTITGEVAEHTTKAGNESTSNVHSVNTGVGYWLKQNEEGGASLYLDGESVQSVLRVSSEWFSDIRFPEGYETDIKLTISQGENIFIPYLAGVPTGTVGACFKDGSMWIDGCICGAPQVTTISDNADPARNYTVSLDVISTAPQMDYVIESQNRLWGCRYGQDRGGKLVNEIYASALGDFRQWYTFAGVSTDSYAASVGISGAFTGAVNYRGYPLFFKENVMFKVYGDYPQNYQIVSDTAMGVQSGCAKSLCVLSGVLYYKSPDGVFTYDGSSGERIDTVLGSERYSNVVCGGTGSKLWLSMESENSAHSGLYVCDVEKGLWHKEDGTKAQFMARYGNDVYIVDEGGQLLTVNGTAGPQEAGDVSFFAETGIIGYSTPDSKYVSRFALRVAVPHDGSLRIFVEYDSANVWEFKGSIEGHGMQTFTVPVVPRRCDHFRIRLEGRGDCRIFGFSKVLEEGGCV